MRYRDTAEFKAKHEALKTEMRGKSDEVERNLTQIYAENAIAESQNEGWTEMTPEEFDFAMKTGVDAKSS